MKKGLFLIVGMLLTVSSAFAQRQWTMRQCIDYALENNITLQKQKLTKESATEDLSLDEPEPGLSAMEGFGYVVCN